MLKRAILDPLLTPVVRPATRYTVRFLAIPAYRALRRKIPRLAATDNEIEKDIEQWFRGALLLLVATKNFELWIGQWLEVHYDHSISEQNWLLTALRLLLAIAVIEAMPDQELFSIIHAGPPKFRRDRGLSLWRNIRRQTWPIVRGILAQHLSRSSAVFAIIAVILGSTVGWVCYGLAIVQYLVIGLVTSRDRVMDVLGEFDRQVARRRQELIDEFELQPEEAASDGPRPDASSQAVVTTQADAQPETVMSDASVP